MFMLVYAQDVFLKRTSFTLYGQQEEEEMFFTIQHNAVCSSYSTKYLFIYPPDAILGGRIPGEENALSHSLYLLTLD